MAKIIKVTGYLVDTWDCLSESEIELAAGEILGSKFDCIAKSFRADSRDIGEWDDNHRLNEISCTFEECERYFDKPAPAPAVVRCVECKHLVFSDCYIYIGECGKGHRGIVRPDDFCGYGERKDGGKNG